MTNGDDAISPKANSTNILVTNSTFNTGSGIVLGSIGQYDRVYEIIEVFTATDSVCNDTTHAAYMKTWTGQQVGYPPNGGGGGLGYMLPLSSYAWEQALTSHQIRRMSTCKILLCMALDHDLSASHMA